MADRAKPRSETQFYSQAANAIRLSGAINETVAFEFVIAADAGGGSGLEVWIDDLIGEGGGTIRASHTRMYRHWPVTIERFPNWYLRTQGPRRSRTFPDALVPIGAPRHGQPFSLAAGESLAIWTEISIPEMVRPGLYRSRVSVRGSDRRVHQTPVELRVTDVILTRETALPALVRVDLGPILGAHTHLDPEGLAAALDNADARQVIHRTFAILHEHGLSPYTDEILPDFTQETGGGVAIDWSKFDAFCGPFIDGSAYDNAAPACMWPIPANGQYPDPARYDGFGSTVYAAVLRDYLSKCRSHFEARDWLAQAVVMFDRPGHGMTIEADRLRRLGTLAHLTDENLRVVSDRIPQAMAPFGWFNHVFEDVSDAVDIWATPARFEHIPTLREQRALGKQSWLVPDRPPYSGSLAVEAPPTHARSLAWQAFVQGHDAMYIDSATGWPNRVFDEPIADVEAPSDTWLVYPGGFFGLNEPVPSVRLKQLFLGLQDYQYLRLLTQHGRAETARLAAGSLIKAAGADAYGDNFQDGLPGCRVEDPEAWFAARRLIEQELVDAVSDNPGHAMDTEVNRSAWRGFLSATRGIDVRVESARLTRDRRTDGAYLASFDVSVRSELLTPLTGGLKFGILPLDWHSASDIVRVGPLGERAVCRSRLVAALPGLPVCDLDGHLTQSVTLDADTSGIAEARGLLSRTIVIPASNPIVVDGSLAEWPPSEGNIAGGFLLIAGAEDPAVEGAQARSQTVAYLCRDADVLYIAIFANTVSEGPPPRGPPVEEIRRFGNVVRYEDLIPRDEDLVEVILDPTGTATQCDDLYHIVLKSTGQAVFERGVGMVPPIGQTGPWIGRQQYMVQVNKGTWTAEVAIPLDSFGPGARTDHVWGLNVTRLEPARGEYSNWAGARRHCYSPATLGNLVWSE